MTCHHTILHSIIPRTRWHWLALTLVITAVSPTSSQAMVSTKTAATVHHPVVLQPVVKPTRPSVPVSASVPGPTATADTRVRTLTYQPHQVVNLATRIGVVIHILLEAGETYLTHALGDADAYAVTVHGRHLFIKPAAEQANTNLIVITDRRCYNFALTLQPGDPEVRPQATLYQLQFRYPDTEARQAQQIAQQQARQAATQQAESPTLAAPSSALHLTCNRDYSYSGDAELVPIQAWDDGRFTYFRFAGHQDLPAIYIQDEDGHESLVNQHITGRARTTVAVHKVHPRWILRLGSRVAAIYNDRLPQDGGASPTGTSRPHLQHHVKEPDHVQ